MLSNQVAAAIAKSVADKPKQFGGGTSARSDKFTQGSYENRSHSAMFGVVNLSLSVFVAWQTLLKPCPLLESERSCGNGSRTLPCTRFVKHVQR
jgi:hypothetical protein